MSRLGTRQRTWAAPIAIGVLALVLLAGPPGASTAPRKEIPVPYGLWSGYGKLPAVTAKIADVDVHVTRGTYAIWFISDPAKGYADLEGQVVVHLIGTGDLNLNGVRVTGNLEFLGDFELGDLPYLIHADGSYRMTGTVIVNGFPVDLDQIIAISSRLTVTSATCTTVKGEMPSGIGPYRWTAKLINDLGTECARK
jgi:hypothetical protein